MTVCILCLEDSLSSRIYLGPTWQQEVNSNILQAVKRLFSVLDLKSNSGGFICSDCWKFVSEFENFYQRICLLHRSSGGHVDRNTLPVEIYLKSIENQAFAEMEDGEEEVYADQEIDLMSQTESIADADIESYVSLKDSREDKDTQALPTSNTLKCTDSDSETSVSSYCPLVKKTKKNEVENNENPFKASFTGSSAVVVGTDVYSEVVRIKDASKRRHNQDENLNHRGRFSCEEVAKRNAQQTAYNDIISNYFNTLSCPKCQESLQNFGDVRGHFRAAHNIESGYVTCCGRKFYLRKYLAEHLLVHSNPEHFKCKTCTRVFKDSRSLVVHENSHENPLVKSKSVYRCDKCPKTFITKAGFEYHCCSKHVPKSDFKFACAECNKKLPTERKLKDHMKHFHDPERAIICDKCGKQVRSQSSLKKHDQKEHSDEPKLAPKPEQCEICGTWLRHLSGLKQHKKTMHEQASQEYRCHICNRVSTNARALKRHIYHNHECERKFKCTMCEKAFKRPQDLREHTATHTGEVLYRCPNCSMAFFSNANMYKHRQRIHRAEWESARKNPNANIMREAVVGASATLRLRKLVDVSGTCSLSHEKTTLDSFTQSAVNLLQ